MRVQRTRGKRESTDSFVRFYRTEFGGLANLARRLNEIPVYRAAASEVKLERWEREQAIERLRAWELAENIIESTSLMRAAEQFTDCAKEYPSRMEVLWHASQPIAVLSMPLRETEVALHSVWNYFFHSQGWTRLKRCKLCGKWFLDTSKNKSTVRCSRACTWKWWSRDRRRAASHTAQTKGGARHGKKKR